MIISRIYEYPWGIRPVFYEKFMLKIVDETLNKTLWEVYAKTEQEMGVLRASFYSIKIGHYKDEIGFTEYNNNCFEYKISIKNDKVIEEHKILVYLTGFIKI